jgi:hypothetical protein
MYRFLQFRPDKKEAWRMFDERQLPNLEQPPAFMTVLQVDQDPEHFAQNGEDPAEHIKYLGPMYFDFDGPSIDEVLADVRSVLTRLTQKLDIDPQFIHCWLSGQKGVHLTIPGRVFGVKFPLKHLPLIYREIAQSLATPFLDMSVYSAGRGRMWRCENIARPVTGTFKVGVTYAELMELDALQYQVLVANPRPSLAQSEPTESLIFPKAESLFKVARATAQQRIKAMKGSKVVPKEILRKQTEVPGCITKLITDGDCAESNWNQAAMQVAAYIAARYEREERDQYTAEIIDPFVVNVESSSRPTERERRKQVEEMLNRSFTGRIKLLPGPLISVLGKPCGGCLLCRGDITGDEQGEGAGQEDVNYDENTGIRADRDGYWHVTDSGKRQLTSFTFQPHTYVTELEDVGSEQGELRESARREMIGTLYGDDGVAHPNFSIDERAWMSRRELLQAVNGVQAVRVFCSDVDIQKLLHGIERLAQARMIRDHSEIERMIRTNMCGILFDRRRNVTIPHYVEADGSCSSQGTQSRYFYSGDAKQAPKLLEEDYPYKDDTELEQTLAHLARINEPHNVATAMGWFVACHFREHIQYHETQFPLLNLSGNAQAGKSSQAVLLAHLNGIDYNRADFVNVEIGSIFPLIKFVSSSSTVPRLVEEANPTNMPTAKYAQVLGILKAAWNRAPIPRGYLSAREVKISQDRVSAPLVFTSEQAPSVPSLRSRTVEVKLTAKALQNPEYRHHYSEASKHRHCLNRIAKALVTKALNTPPSRILEIMEEVGVHVPDSIGPRPKWSFQCVLTGLALMIETLEDYEVQAVDDIQMLVDALVEHLDVNAGEMEREKSVSEVDRVLNAMNQLADEPDDRTTGLRPGDHYWRQGDNLYLIVSACLPRYCRYARTLGDQPVIRETRQMVSLLEGEIYFDRREAHPHREGVEVHVLSLAKLRKKGTVLTNFQDGTEPTEN